jgi:hypothetical protein
MSDDLDRQEAAWLRGQLDSELAGLDARPEALRRILARAHDGAGDSDRAGAEGAPPVRPLPGAAGDRRRPPTWLVAAAAVAAVAAAVPAVRAARDGVDGASSTSGRPSASATPTSTSPSPARTVVGPVPPASSSGTTSRRAVSPTASPATSATSTTAAPPARCDLPTLLVSVTGPGAAAGTVYHTVVLTNTGDRACYLEGFPGVAATDGTTTVDARRDTTVAASKVVLEPGRAAHAVLAVRNLPMSNTPCPSYSRLLVTAPDSRRTTSIPLQVRPCDGVMAVTVVRPGAG